ncbi:hypothetical protein HPB47_008596 [Ixodes persulcatus]|uniref:Uncharacterized protein n=1 Tax=Ixodes persulcatus TaxID=34615 RepID=A0AC60P4B8_IXOPE|nr:hypothetical protein HPB47_008596 [Ixodes persulcatus]
MDSPAKLPSEYGHPTENPPPARATPLNAEDYHHGGQSGSQISSPGSGYNGGYGAPTNGHQDHYEGPPWPVLRLTLAAVSASSKRAQSPTSPATAPGVPTRPQAAGPYQGSLLIVYGLNSDKMNAEKLFNLFCLYGNIVNINFSKNKMGCIMVQMEDRLAKERAVGHQNNAQVSEIKMQLGY